MAGRLRNWVHQVTAPITATVASVSTGRRRNRPRPVPNASTPVADDCVARGFIHHFVTAPKAKLASGWLPMRRIHGSAVS